MMQNELRGVTREHVARMKKSAFVLALALFIAAPGAASDRTLSDAAITCSDDALRRYATTSPDPAPQIAEAAFDVCRQAWDAAVDALVAESGLKGFDPWLAHHDEWHRSPRRMQEEMFRLQGRNGAWSGFKGGYIARATPLVFELRARAAGK